MDCLVKSEALSKSMEKSQLGADAAQHSNCNALNHPQPFDARKRIPVFLATAQAQILVPKSSDNYTSISYDHSVTSVVSSNVTLSSGLSTPLPIIDYKPCNESKTNSFSNLLKKLYRDISHLEEMMLLVDSGECRDEFSDDASVVSSTFSSSATDGLSTPSPIFDHNPRDEFGDNASVSSISSYTHSAVSSMFSSSASDELSAPSPIFDHHPRSEDGDDDSISSVSSYAHSVVSSTFSSSATDGLSTSSPISDYSPHEFSNNTFNSFYAHSTISSTHSSGTDRSSIPSPIFGHNPCDESKANAFSNVLEDLHHGISHLEMILEMLLADSGKPEDESHVVIKGGLSDGADEVENA